MTSRKSLDVLGLQFPHLNLATLKHGSPVPCRSSHWEVQASVPSHAIWALWQLRRQNLAQILLCQCPNPGLLKNNRISLYVSWGTHSQDPATMLWGNPTSPWRSPMGWPAPLGQPGKWAILEIHPIAAQQIVSAYPPVEQRWTCPMEHFSDCKLMWWGPDYWCFGPVFGLGWDAAMTQMPCIFSAFLVEASRHLNERESMKTENSW